MNLLEIKAILKDSSEITFQLPNGEFVPSHFHITEIGVITKDFIDCGGTLRHEKNISFQLWEANDFEHRLSPQKLLSIISIAENKLGLGNWNIEIEYQNQTIGKYDLDFNGKNFLLLNKSTNCLASDACGIPQEKLRTPLSELTNSKNTCTPGGGCC